MRKAMSVKRRGTGIDPENRFERLRLEEDPDACAEADSSLRVLPTEVYRDNSQSVVTENDSPDIPFRFSLNPYRGCEHGCTYCYARPSHEFLGWSAGLDFERRIMAKADAPQLLKRFLRRPSYRCEPITLSGVTDPYQPIERKLRITRACLEIMLDCGQPVELISKGRLLRRDMDLFTEFARRNLIGASISVTTLDESLQRTMEPRASRPVDRMETIRQLTEAGVPVRVLVAPLIPGLTDSEVPKILEAARYAGARSAGYVLLRLPFAVKDVFLEWLDRAYPQQSDKILGRLRQMRGGKLYDSTFGARQKGTGPMAEEIGKLFDLFKKKLNLDRPIPALDCSQFRPPADPSGQQTLF